MAVRDGKLRQVLREQCKGFLDYWEKFEIYEQYARVELKKVDFECSKHGFTLHGIKHAENVEEKLERLIPLKLLVNDYDLRDNDDALSPEELFILLLATWSHDFGMMDPGQRQIHNCLSRDYIWDSEKKESKVLWCSLESNFAFYVGQLCYAHRDHRDQDGKRVNTLSAIEDATSMKGNRIRPRLLVALLRLADELDVGFHRAPEDVMYVTNLSEDSAKYWVSDQLINSVDIDSTKLTISLVPFKAKVEGNPLYEKLVDARCLKIQEELDGMRSILRNSPFDYKEVCLGEEPIRRIMLRNLLNYQGHSIERYKDAMREMVFQVEEYHERFEGLAHIAQQLEEIAGSCKRLAVRPIFPPQPPGGTGAVNALVAASDSGWRNKLREGLRPRFEDVVEVDSTSKAIQAISEQEFAVIVTELNLDTERAGFEVLQTARERSRHTQVIMLAPQDQTVSADAMMRGAYDCLEYTHLQYASESAKFIKEVQAKIDKALDARARKRKGEANHDRKAAI